MQTRLKYGPAGGALRFFLLAGRSNRGPAEETGERIDETARKDHQERIKEISDNQPGPSA
ncbi:MAG: hypothetical protein KFF45_10715 [Thioalkalivibrio sp.]|nr:hypothetical protein [Thioalkalivibrio sp.]